MIYLIYLLFWRKKKRKFLISTVRLLLYTHPTEVQLNKRIFSMFFFIFPEIITGNWSSFSPQRTLNKMRWVRVRSHMCVVDIIAHWIYMIQHTSVCTMPHYLQCASTLKCNLSKQALVYFSISNVIRIFFSSCFSLSSPLLVWLLMLWLLLLLPIALIYTFLFDDLRSFHMYALLMVVHSVPIA